MKQPSNDTKLNYNTHNRTQSNSKGRGSFCWNAKPCNRDRCDYCWSRRLKYMTQQISLKANEWQLEQMVTILVQHEFEHPQLALKVLIKLRTKVLRKLRKLTKTISVVSIDPKHGHQYPHYHILTAAIDEKTIKTLLMGALPFKQNIRVTRRDGDRVNRMKGALAYILKKNLRYTLIYKAKGMRLLSSSRGFFTGRPSYKGTFRWLI